MHKKRHLKHSKVTFLLLEKQHRLCLCTLFFLTVLDSEKLVFLYILQSSNFLYLSDKSERRVILIFQREYIFQIKMGQVSATLGLWLR